MISNSTYISTQEVVWDVLWDAHAISGLPGLTTALSAFMPRSYLPRPWLVLLTKTWLTAWPPHILATMMTFLFQYNDGCQLCLFLKKTVWAGRPSPTWVAWLACSNNVGSEDGYNENDSDSETFWLWTVEAFPWSTCVGGREQSLNSRFMLYSSIIMGRAFGSQ